MVQCALHKVSRRQFWLDIYFALPIAVVDCTRLHHGSKQASLPSYIWAAHQGPVCELKCNLNSRLINQSYCPT